MMVEDGTFHRRIEGKRTDVSLPINAMLPEFFRRMGVIPERGSLEYLPELGKRIVVERRNYDKIAKSRLSHSHRLAGQRDKIGDPHAMMPVHSHDLTFHVIQRTGECTNQIISANSHSAVTVQDNKRSNQCFAQEERETDQERR